MDRTCLSYWFPKLEVAGLPVPRTKIVCAPAGGLLDLLDGKLPEGWAEFLTELNAARAAIGGTVFLRTGQGSGKHQWRETCCLPETASLADRVGALVEWSQLVDFMGLATDVWAVREMLPVSSIGVCERYGGMPVVREFRFFVRDGDVVCHHPYWPRGSLAQGGFTPNSPDVSPNWYEEFCRLPMFPDLWFMATFAGKAVGGGYWSIDLLETRRGYFITDMAEGEKSWHWPDCPHAKGAKS